VADMSRVGDKNGAKRSQKSPKSFKSSRKKVQKNPFYKFLKRHHPIHHNFVIENKKRLSAFIC
jgi:hypothetical protein